MMFRSSLEEMLENLRRRNEKPPPDFPPRLPSRPTSRARLPSARRSLPPGFKIASAGDSDVAPEADAVTWERRNAFRIHQSPYEGGVSGVSSGGGNVKGVVEWDDNIDYFIEKKLRVWCRLSSGQWELGRILSTSGKDSRIQLTSNNVVEVSTTELLPANPDILDGVDDLVQLSYLNEPSILNNLYYRYTSEQIYSKAGPVLIAINPFKAVPLHRIESTTEYRQKLAGTPHVYGTADAAYDKMMRDGVNQSIIVSGESGAGKTETAKLAMQYLATVGGGGDGIEHKILQTNCLLESFGNAKTLRNDNSSRFVRGN